MTTYACTPPNAQKTEQCSLHYNLICVPFVERWDDKKSTLCHRRCSYENHDGVCV